VWPFTESQEISEPTIAPPIDRVQETQRRVRALKNELDLLDAEMLKFKTENRITTDRFSRLLGVNCNEITGRAAIEREWRVLLRRRDALVSAWHRALFEWSQAKERQQP